MLQEIMGQDPRTDFGRGRSRGVLFEFVRRIESAQKDQPSKRVDLIEEQLIVVGKILLTKDHEWMTEKIRETKKGHTIKAPFNDGHFSHLCHFGFLKQPLPRDCPAVFRRLFGEIPAVLLTLARTDGDAASKLKAIVQRHNNFHLTEQVSLPFA